MPIVFTDDDEEKSWCNPPCGALLYERKDGSKICSYCGRVYLPDSVNKHKKKLSPSKSRRSDEGPIAIPMTEYGTTPKRKQVTLDREERAMAAKKSGFHWTDIQQWPEEH